MIQEGVKTLPNGVAVHRGTLLPGLSTHFRCTESYHHPEKGCECLWGHPLTKGRIYTILKWTGGTDYSFRDDRGDIVIWMDYWGVEDCSFERNLKRILE